MTITPDILRRYCIPRAKSLPIFVSLYLVLAVVPAGAANISSLSPPPTNWWALVFDIALLVCLPLGVFLTRGYLHRTDPVWGALESAYKISSDDESDGTEKIRNHTRVQAGKLRAGEMPFLIWFAVIFAAYVGSHCWVTVQSAPPISDTENFLFSLVPVAITSLALAFMTYLVVRYCCYMRLLNILGALIKIHHDSTPGDMPGLRKFIGLLRKKIFLDETWFEPPGNVFVTVGIAATFLGLASGLTTMHFQDLFMREHAELTLSGFVRYMGLGLGVSVIGVTMAIAAQILRGWTGPSMTTEELLSEARHIEAGKDPEKKAERSSYEILESLDGQLKILGATGTEQLDAMKNLGAQILQLNALLKSDRSAMLTSLTAELAPLNAFLAKLEKPPA
jgi:hypothetical protein